MENNGRLFGFLAFLLILIPLAYFGCGNDGDDDSDDTNDDDQTDDDVDDDTSPEVGTFYRYVDFIDTECPYNDHLFEIINLSTCNEDVDPALPEGVNYSYYAITIHFDNEYGLEQLHRQAEQVPIDDNDSCWRGFVGYVVLSDESGDYVTSEDGYVDVQRLDDSNYRVEFDITYKDGSSKQGVWTAEPCGEPVPD